MIFFFFTKLSTTIFHCHWYSYAPLQSEEINSATSLVLDLKNFSANLIDLKIEQKLLHRDPVIRCMEETNLSAFYNWSTSYDS